MINPLWLLSRKRLRRRVRCLLITLDGVGCGALPDAGEFGDEGVNTLAHVAEAASGLKLPNLGALGLGNILPLAGVPPAPRPQAMFGKLREQSRGKDTTVGHWELMGVVTKKAFPVYPDGFPPDVIESFKKATGRGVLGNIPASGTQIINELGVEHLRTGSLIVYTSADSVFQIAAHDDVVTPEELYEYCRKARDILRGEHEVVRVIARPFTGEAGEFTRTPGRRDFSVVPPRTYLNILAELGVPVHGVGKISQIYAGSGVRYEHKTGGNAEGLEKSISLMRELEEGLVFTNLVDFDMLWGHRNDPTGFAAALEEVDAAVPELIASCGENDLMILTADHGCDPVAPGTDHTREYIPLLARMGSEVFSPGGSLFEAAPAEDGGGTGRQPRDEPYLGEFADVGATVFRFFTGPKLEIAEALRLAGRPFLVSTPGGSS
ncbi:MAG: phosphopentomutase [Actinobacteria bacterium]|nr:phosphopentomutase [Actinomycetota bacterium]